VRDGFRLDRLPVPGWRLSAADIGLPHDVPVDKPFASSGGRGYFVAHCDIWCDDRGWVYGVDLRTGARLFDPVELDGFRGGFDGECYQSGPSTALCITDEDREHDRKPRGRTGRHGLARPRRAGDRGTAAVVLNVRSAFARR
jgi:hypothetical protein